jgi:predicted phage terminase large subunit-like protein
VDEIAAAAERLHDALTPGTPIHQSATGILAGLLTPPPAPVPVREETTPPPAVVPAREEPPPAPKKHGPYAPWARRALAEATAPEPDERGMVTQRIPGGWRVWHVDYPAETTMEREAEQEAYLLAFTLYRMLTPEGCEEVESEILQLGPKLSFADFFRQAWQVLEESTDLVWNWHLTLMCCVAQAVFFDWMRAKKDPEYQNKVRNVLVNLPPGSSKSRLWSVCLLAWMWTWWPGLKAVCLSVNDDAAMRDARDMRKLITSKWYVETFQPTWRLKDDQDAVSNFGNTAGGERLSMPSRSKIVGLRGDLLLIDDANDPSENDKERAEVNKNWDDAQANRVNDLAKSMRIGVQQRVGVGDWSEHVLGEKERNRWAAENIGGWLHVVLPAEFDPKRKFVMPDCLVEILRTELPPEEILTEDPRKQQGETIDKKRLGKQAMEDERRRWEGTGNFAAQMNQSPADTTNARVKPEYWNWFRLEAGVRDDIDDETLDHPRPDKCAKRETQPAHLVPSAHYQPGKWDFDWITLSLDCAAKFTERGSQWGILFAAGKDGKRYILDDMTQRGDILDIVEILRKGIKKWRPDTVLIEDKAAGEELRKRLLHEMTKGDMPMVELVLLKPSLGGDGREKGKEQRLDACISVLANRLVYLLDGAPWLEDFVGELAAFPNGRWNDRVDALTQILNHYVEFDEDDWPDL